jgi:hypothetical protein
MMACPFRRKSSGPSIAEVEIQEIARRSWSAESGNMVSESDGIADGVILKLQFQVVVPTIPVCGVSANYSVPEPKPKFQTA